MKKWNRLLAIGLFVLVILVIGYFIYMGTRV